MKVNILGFYQNHIKQKLIPSKVVKLQISLYQDLRKKPGFYSKSLFLTHKYLREIGFTEFAFVSPV